MPVRYLINTVLVVLLFFALQALSAGVLSTYQNKVLLLVGINIILAVSLNVATGYLGQLPLGHAGFMAVGAYTSALFTKYCTWPEPVAFAAGLALGALMACLFGVLIGIPALRLSGDYLAILTLGFGEIIRITLNNIDNVLGFSLFYGAKGLKNIPKYSDLLSVFLCVVLTCFFIHTMRAGTAAPSWPSGTTRSRPRAAASRPPIIRSWPSPSRQPSPGWRAACTPAIWAFWTRPASTS